MSNNNVIEEVYLEDDELEETEEVKKEGIVKRGLGKFVGFVKRHPIVTSAIAGTIGVIAGKKIAGKKASSNITYIDLTEDGAAGLTSDDDPDDSNDNVD